jgi:hypothetical protein
MLPARILVHAGENRYILFATECVNRIFQRRDVRCAKLIPMKNPGLKGCWLKTDTNTESSEMYIERESKRHESQIYKCDVHRTSSYIETNRKIHVYVFSRFIVLPSICYHILNGHYLDMNWHVELGTTPIEQKEKIPGHVLKGYIDGLIRNKETCPVTLEEFSLGNITVTGCGHAFEKGSLDTLSHCPLCRVNLLKEEFVSL